MAGMYKNYFYVYEHWDCESDTHHDGFRKAVVFAYHAEGQAKEPIGCGQMGW